MHDTDIKLYQFYVQVFWIFWDFMQFYGAVQVPTWTKFPGFYTIFGSPKKIVKLGSYCISNDIFTNVHVH
jgi:hypothetical protein